MTSNESPVFDMDTHVEPDMALLRRYTDPKFSSLWEKLKPYETEKKNRDGTTFTTLTINPKPYSRLFGSPSAGTEKSAGPGGHPTFTGRVVGQGPETPTPGVSHDQAKTRLIEMDREGVGVHLIIAGIWSMAISALEAELQCGLLDAYSRYLEDYCSQDPARLKGVVIVPAVDPEQAVAQIRRVEDQPWLGGIAVCFPKGLAPDDPALHGLWQAIEATRLPFVFHPFTYEPPYFPGSDDVFDNMALARTSAHPWSAQRMVAVLTMSGMFDRYPNLNLVCSETGAGWLPFWLARIEMNSGYLPTHVVQTSKSASGFARDGRVTCAVELFEGSKLTRATMDVLGEGIVMYSSDYPHSECQWPNSLEVVRQWSDELTPTQMDHLLFKNAARLLSRA